MGVQGWWSEGYFQHVISGAGKEGVVDGQARENLSWVEGLGASLSDSRSSPARVVEKYKDFENKNKFHE
ncbi:hypothetical protein E2C01_025743 [Portunus trituberculatus]|uniref:Uncharacterized protein n=1 Tax=Portunus trituberculatus TaxID=210409 RepID=A0A5B7EE60_PORTR|nr:hypothetical protein [Portunus trituberculatus]